MSRVAGSSLLIIAAEASTNTKADASKGSKNPAAIPTATQFLYQNVSRCPGLMLIFLKDMSAACSGARVCSIYRRNSSDALSSEMCALEKTAPIPLRVGKPISHIHPALWAVEIVCDAIGLSSRA